MSSGRKHNGASSRPDDAQPKRAAAIDWPGYRSDVKHVFLHGIPALILLVAATAIIHRFHWIPPSDEYFARLVAANQSVDVDDERLQTPLFQVIEINSVARAAMLERTEMKSPSAEVTFTRTDGVRPIGREQIGGLLATLAAALEDRKRKSSKAVPKVIGIDIDLAPLEDEPISEKIKDALTALRMIAPVVVIAADRSRLQDKEARNQFLVEAGCTLSADLDRDKQSPISGLFFASPLLFTKFNEAPFRFPAEKESSSHHSSKESQSVPDWFPSLGVLMHLAMKHATEDGIAGRHQYRSQSEANKFEASRSAERNALTALCNQASAAHDARSEKAIMQDELTGRYGSNDHVQAMAAAYRHELYNWRLLSHTHLARTVINDQEFKQIQEPSGEQLELRLLEADALLVSVAGVGGIDRYFVPFLPGSVEQWPSGAMLHALAAASLQERVKTVSWEGLGIDFLIGLGFLVGASVFVPVILRLRAHMQFVGGALLALLPIGLAIGLFIFGMNLAARWLSHGLWFNPIYVIAGLCAHAYLEPWALMQAQDKMEAKHPFFFGFHRLREAFVRRGKSQAFGNTTLAGVWDSMLEMFIKWLMLTVGIAVLIEYLFKALFN